MTKILVLNGFDPLEEIEDYLVSEFPVVEFAFRRADHEGEMVDWLRGALDCDGLIINPGARTHYSPALHDALEAVAVPKVEAHLSNIHAGEDRRLSVVSPAVDAVVAGMGIFGYRAAVSHILQRIS
ncbi:MAG: type II 3-dehydroquinate dehydratase [Rubrobacteraceae bacterium]